MEPKVCVVIDFMGVGNMFRRFGCDVVFGEENMEGSDLVAFTGGEDISPYLYGEHPGSRTSYSPERDRVEISGYYKALELDIPVTGICRGAQLINVLNGGKLLQHVTRHGNDHIVEDVYGNTYWSSSIHHQMLIRTPDSILIGWSQEGGEKWTVDENHKYQKVVNPIDPEVVFYPKFKSLLIQGHPEINSPNFYEMTNTYFWYLSELLGFKCRGRIVSSSDSNV